MSKSISINSIIYQKLQNIASAQNCELHDCLEQALREYIDNYEDNSQSDLENLSNSERAFFFSIAE